MKRFVYLCAQMCLWLTITTTVFAHPGSGIVMDSRGNIFFTDLKQVWKVTPEGKKTVAVANVHSHESALTVKIIFTANIYGTKAKRPTSGGIACGACNAMANWLT